MQKLTRLEATILGIGYLPLAPGTWASMAALGAWWVMPWRGPMQWIVALLCIPLAIRLSGSYARGVGREDPSEVVVDEWVGMWVALAGFPKNLIVVLLVLAFFRLFDIIKSPPVRQLERLPGGFGIVLDDVAAGLLAKTIAWLVLVLFFR